MADIIAEVFERADGKWAWHAMAANREIVASDAGQGYENRSDAENMMGRVLGGHYSPGGAVVSDPGMEVLVPVIRSAMEDAFAGRATDVEMAARYVADRVRKVVWP